MTSGDQPLGVTGFVREHTVWLLGLLPFVLAGFKVLVVSAGYNEVLLQLVQNLNVVQLMLATVIPLLPLVLFWAWVLWLDWTRSNPEAFRKIPEWAYVPLFGGLGGVILYMNVVWFIVSVAVLLFALWKRRRERKKLLLRYGPDIGHYLYIRINVPQFVILLAVLTFTNSSSMWLPHHAVTIKGAKPVAAYVLSADERWTTIMDDQKHIQTVKSSDIESVNTCAVRRSWASGPVIGLVPPSSPNTPCPR